MVEVSMELLGKGKNCLTQNRCGNLSLGGRKYENSLVPIVTSVQIVFLNFSAVKLVEEVGAWRTIESLIIPLWGLIG